METFALFSDKTFSAIKFDFLGVSKSDPLLTIIMDTDDEEVKNSAEKGIRSAYSILQKMRIIPNGKKYCIVCEFEGESSKGKVSGQSAGLAFSLKFAQEIYYKEKGQALEGSIAATGEISDRTATAQVTEVTDINNKFYAALNCLNPEDKIFFPLGNEQIIDAQLKKQISKQGIKLCPANTVEQAIASLIEPKKLKPWHVIDKIKEWRIGIPSFGLLLVILWYALIRSPLPCYEQAVSLLEQGEFFEAKTNIESCLNNKNRERDNDNLVAHYNQINTDLSVVIEFEYFKENKQETLFKSLLPTNSLSDILLGTQDGYRFKIVPEENCYAYLFQFDSSDGVELLFPRALFSIENHNLTGQTQYMIPGGDNLFYLADETHHGQITLYFVVSFWRAKDVEKIFNEYEKTYGDKKINTREKLLNRILERKKALDSGMKGIFFRKEFFLQE